MTAQDAVQEKADLVAETTNSGTKIHLGDLLTICSIKFSEMAQKFWKYKGRICFSGDCVRDQDGAAAVFQELSASPTSVSDANSTICYGLLQGNVNFSS